MKKRFAFRQVAAGKESKADTRVLLVSGGRALGAMATLSPADAAALAAWMDATHFDGAVAATAWPVGLSQPVLLAGTGSAEEFCAARWVRCWAAIGKALTASAARIAAFEWPADAAFSMPIEALLKLAVEGLWNGAYVFDRFRTAAAPRTVTLEWHGAALAAPSVREAIRRGDVVGATLTEMRDIANLPANELGPVELAAFAKRLATANGLSCRVWDEPALRKEKCGALLAVGSGSRRPPRLIRLAYTPRAGARQAPLVLVGKAILFDSGGICLKPGKGMEWMQYDKCGGLTALTAVLLAARLRLPRPVVALVPAVENMPGGGAARPGDIVRSRSGKTIEIINTDAEGRLILADALSFAADEKPAAVVDIATLTGAVVIALGHWATGLAGNNDSLLLELMLSGEATGERLWQLPLWSEYGEPLKGRFADLKNMGDGTAGTIAAAAFLKAFAPPGVPWAHLDIAGTAWRETDATDAAPGATLCCARLLADWIERAAWIP